MFGLGRSEYLAGEGGRDGLWRVRVGIGVSDHGWDPGRRDGDGFWVGLWRHLRCDDG